MDIWDKKKRSEVMSKIRSKDTNPEIMLRKALFAKGYRYRINYKKLPGKPDIVLPKYKTAIFVHGCFWHAHEGCKIAHIPKTNVEFWTGKLNKNKERDKKNKSEIQALGWEVITVWECEVTKKALSNIIENIISALNREEVKGVPPVKVKIYGEVGDHITLVAESIIPYGESND